MKRCSACARIVSRVRSFFRARSPEVRSSADAGKLTVGIRLHALILLQRIASRQEQQGQRKTDDRDPAGDHQRDVHPRGERAANRVQQCRRPDLLGDSNSREDTNLVDVLKHKMTRSTA